MRLAQTEYERFLQLLQSLAPGDWAKPTECAGWDVRAMAAHLLGMAEMSASIRESMRQLKIAQGRGGEFIDALTGLQVEERAHLSPADIIEQYARVTPKAAQARRRTPWFLRRQKMSPNQVINGREETWTLGFLTDVIMTRDPWMHRADISRTTGAELVLTHEHDGLLVNDVVQEWAERHGRSFNLRLTGPAGGTWSSGAAPEVALDAVEFCRALSGRAQADGLPPTEVPF
ncbi:maleylpyruvate isomerase family mycothiol-dependent enzyme [Lentzea tibetensis]|uniref:Maleylpyruvate isomerase family mycothiol-dependent enzyme n=2 Tax=Lentzea tibetensis TaxID=2591470 RepID=A0A563EXH0_9PSEU|nr:maleylpyruvate isomerase family mycothiol-dependent enzyme [Lentzea tibetensis]